MTKQELEAYLAAMTDDELRERTEEAVADLKAVAVREPNSEWREACFAAVLAFGLEVQRRGLNARTLH